MHFRPGGQQTTRSMDAQKFLEDRAIEILTNQTVMSFVAVFLHPDACEDDGPAFAIGQILGGFREIATAQEQIDGEWVGHKTKVVDVLLVEDIEPGERYRLPTLEQCDKPFVDCGRGARVPCYKRHNRTFHLSSLRPPCGPDARRDLRAARSSARVRAAGAATGAASSSEVSAAIEYAMLPSAKQALLNALTEDARRFGAAYVI
mmetsp:Transcript_9061/g.37285  ORF Transcript_9061/g.37285 Transcript_9061/m.37285 type:complete len:204 (+) Transcript_9061:345-956(+)